MVDAGTRPRAAPGISAPPRSRRAGAGVHRPRPRPRRRRDARNPLPRATARRSCAGPTVERLERVPLAGTVRRPRPDRLRARPTHRARHRGCRERDHAGDDGPDAEGQEMQATPASSPIVCKDAQPDDGRADDRDARVRASRAPRRPARGRRPDPTAAPRAGARRTARDRATSRTRSRPAPTSLPVPTPPPPPPRPAGQAAGDHPPARSDSRSSAARRAAPRRPELAARAAPPPPARHGLGARRSARRGSGQASPACRTARLGLPARAPCRRRRLRRLAMRPREPRERPCPGHDPIRVVPAPARRQPAPPAVAMGDPVHETRAAPASRSSSRAGARADPRHASRRRAGTRSRRARRPPRAPARARVPPRATRPRP